MRVIIKYVVVHRLAMLIVVCYGGAVGYRVIFEPQLRRRLVRLRIIHGLLGFIATAVAFDELAVVVVLLANYFEGSDRRLPLLLSRRSVIDEILIHEDMLSGLLLGETKSLLMRSLLV